MTKKDMLECLINHFTDGNKAKFAAKVGVSPQLISTWLSRDTFDIEKIYSTCEGVSANWLLSDGNGEMLLPAAAGSSTSVLSHNYIEGNGNLSGNQILSPGVPVAAADGDGDDSPAVLRERVKALQQLLDEKERTIKILLDKKRNE